MTFFHHPLAHSIRILRSAELNELYVSVFLRTLSSSIISIFVPVFLYQLGFSIGQIALFYAVDIAVMVLLYPLGFFLATKIGVKHLMAIGTFLFLGFYLLMPLVEQGLYYLLPAVINAIANMFYWSGFHAQVTRVVSKEHGGKELSLFQILSILATLLGPLIGAILILFFSFNTTFVIVSFIMLLSVVPLFFTQEYFLENSLTLKDVFSQITMNKLFGHIGEGIENYATIIVWPLFIYVLVQGVLSLGIIVSLSALPIMWYVWKVSAHVDKSPLQVLRYGVYASSFSWLLRPLILHPIGLFIMNFVNTLINNTIHVSFHKIIYLQAKKSVSYIYFREVFLGLGRIIVLAVLFISNSFFVTFFFAGVGTLLCLQMLRAR